MRMYNRTVSRLFLLLALLLIVFQYCTLAKFSVLPPSVSYLSFTRFWAATKAQVIFSTFDLFLLSALVLVAGAIVGSEIKSNAVSRWLQYMLASEKRTWGLLTCACLLSVRYYFAPGEISWAGDAAHHIATADMAAQAMRSGEIPVWTFYMGGGSPYLQNYGFLFFYFVGFIDLFCRDIFLSLKWVLAFGHVLSGLGMYAFARLLYRSRRAAFVAGLAYVLCFWHAQHVLIMGRLPLALFYGLLPWAFAAMEIISHARCKMAAAASGGVVLALLSFTHTGYGAFAFIFLAVYATVRLLQERKHIDIKRRFLATCALFFWGVLFSAYINIGMWAERKFTNLHDFSPGIKSAGIPEQMIPDPTWLHLLSWSNFRFWLWAPDPFHWYGGYMGVSLFALAAISIAYLFLSWRERRCNALWAGFTCLLLAWSFTFAYRYPPVSLVQLVQAFNASRYLLFFSFFLALLSGAGCYFLLRAKVLSMRRSNLFSLVILVVLVDLGTTTFLHPYRSDKSTPTGLPDEIFAQISQEAQADRSASGLPSYRAQWIADDVHRALSIGQILQVGRMPTLEAFHPGELRALNDFTGPLSDIARKILTRIEDPEKFSSHPYAGLLTAGFFLANTRNVLVTSSRGFGYVLPFTESAPIAVAPRLEAHSDAMADSIEVNAALMDVLDLDRMDRIAVRRIKNLLWVISGMEVRPGQLACERIYIRDLEEAIDLGTTPVVEVVDHVVDHQKVTLVVRASQACYARLSYAYFAFLHVMVDGVRVVPMQTAGRFLAIELKPGTSEISIEARLSPLRLGLLWAAIVGGLAAALVVYIEHRRLQTTYPKR